MESGKQYEITTENVKIQAYKINLDNIEGMPFHKFLMPLEEWANMPSKMSAEQLKELYYGKQDKK